MRPSRPSTHSSHHSTRPGHPLPSPTGSSPVSPTKRPSASTLPMHSAEDDSGDDEAVSGEEKTKLETRREKNRIKQRNLRQRRADHISELEGENSRLKTQIASLNTEIQALQHRESNLNAWIRDLESALYSGRLGAEVSRLRSIWTALVNPNPQPQSQIPLEALANAAAASRHPQPHSTSVQPRPPSASSSSRNSFSGSSLPYPTPYGSFDSQMSTSASASYWHEDRKRKRYDEPQLPLPPHEAPYHHRADTLPPLNPSLRSSHQPLPPFQHYEPRPTTAPHFPGDPFQPVRSEPPTYSAPLPSTTHHDAPYQSHPMQITNLLSPTNPDTQGDFGASSVGTSYEGERRWSMGEISVIDHSLTFDQATSASQIVAPSTHAHAALPGPFTQGIHQSFPTFTLSIPADLPPLLTGPSAPLDMNIPHLHTHPAILACRSLLYSLLPTPLPFPLPPLPPLEPAHQKLLLLALTALVPQMDQPIFHQRQLKFIPAEDAKRLLQYQSDPNADTRLVLFPIAIMRAKAVQAIMDGRDMDVTAFINETLADARIFGATLDPDAWEMSVGYWDVWEGWIPRGKAYCHSLSKWRRRDGHTGSSVLEMILGLEGEHARRSDPVGKPPNWTF